MSEKLLRTSQLSEKLNVGKDTAKAIMLANGVQPISLGVGRGRGFRWLASAVDAVILRLHEDAQGTQKKRPFESHESLDLTALTIEQLYDLTHIENAR